jgi:hypothetical protein
MEAGSSFEALVIISQTARRDAVAVARVLTCVCVGGGGAYNSDRNMTLPFLKQTSRRDHLMDRRTVEWLSDASASPSIDTRTSSSLNF